MQYSWGLNNNNPLMNISQFAINPDKVDMFNYIREYYLKEPDKAEDQEIKDSIFIY